MGQAPAAFAPMTALRPTPPRPKTATEDPGSTRAVLNTAPTPVITAQPNKAASSNGASSGIRMADSCATTVKREKAETPR